VQALNYLAGQGVVKKIRRGVWAETGAEPLSTFAVIHSLLTGAHTCLSFVSALHLHGIIEQIPQQITCASIAHSKTIQTTVGTFSIHHIASEFFFGYDWYKKNAGFMVACPEKALLDCLYISGRKGKRFSYFPELHIPETFSFKQARLWVKRINDIRLRNHVLVRLEKIEADAEIENSAG
jgi:predicted transcriptional regulator of viral defense system